MKKIILVLLAFCTSPSFGQLTANDVINKIKAAVNCEWSAETVDNVKAGDPNTEVKGIATTFMATLEVLRKANATGLNFVITHEPTFYSHTDDLSTHADSPIQQAKLKFIEDNNMVVWRFHDHIHKNNPDMIYEGVIDVFDWKQYRKDGVFFEIPEMTLAEIVADIETKFGAKTLRTVGDPEEKFTNVGMALGASGSGSHFNRLANPATELLIVGETNEWETVPYVQDAISLGYKKALIVMGHADSEEAGMAYFAKWLQELYEEVPIKFIEAKNPYWRSK
ncbi:Nif3-like dinuclear metal center hexameric protein [uncultured Arcticibacterium sp.]|uniref:Nif3-like dinuclear metal center hexameric protein n=1 Tax=uncultured Arcticibacterium sp. TaxID=2173042 RepID=UPI0030F61413